LCGVFVCNEKNTDSFNVAEREHLLLADALLSAHPVMCMHTVCFWADRANRSYAVNQVSLPRLLSLLARVRTRCITEQHEQRLCNYLNRR